MNAHALLCSAAILILSATQLVHSQPVTSEVIGTINGVEQLLLVEPIGKTGAQLLPDTCFFSGTLGGLKLTGASQKADPEQLNGGNTYTAIEGLENPSQRVVWPLLLKRQGAISGKIVAKGTGRLKVTLGSLQTSVETSSKDGAFTIQSATIGQTELAISVETFRGSLERIELSGPGLEEARLLRARWRPSAVHAGFTSSSLGKENSRLWIMEVRPLPSQNDFYSPITTPFGYFGSTFNADGTSSGINFSMWSFSAGKQEPPIAQLSHLLAVGSAQATFDGFTHEGTGVKPRKWNPYAGRKLTNAPLALRLDPGDPYDTYTGYFFDEAIQSWRLYASGRKWSGKGSTQNLLPGCFVEVPGPPHIQRTGHIVRSADLRGWCRDSTGTWHTLDTMNGSKSDAAREQTNSLWSRSPDGWFRMATGGLTHFRYPNGVVVKIDKFKDLPSFLSPEKVWILNQIPSTIRVLSATRQGNALAIEVELSSTCTSPSAVKALVGSTDALSFAERWERTEELGSIKPGRTRLILPKVPSSGVLRLKLTNSDGIFVTPDATSWK